MHIMHGIVFFAGCVRDVCLSGCSWGDTDVGYSDVFCLHENQGKRCISQGAERESLCELNLLQRRSADRARTEQLLIWMLHRYKC